MSGEEPHGDNDKQFRRQKLDTIEKEIARLQPQLERDAERWAIERADEKLFDEEETDAADRTEQEVERQPPSYPTLDEAALHGLAGDIVKATSILKAEDLAKVEQQPPWQFIKSVPAFLAEEDKEFQGWVKNMLTPGTITMIAAPRGLGKSLYAQALGNALAQASVFCGEQLKQARVLLIDRDNPEAVTKGRLRGWGGEQSDNLSILTRQYAPDLKNKEAWAVFPVEHFDIVMIDSVGASTEGVTEKEGRQTTEILATILNVAHRGLSVLLLNNAIKDGSTLKGRGEWADRCDIVYEVRDATGYVPTGKKNWWQELPDFGEAAWADRAARRKGRSDFRLAFICSKFRLGPEPEPFCLELNLPEGGPWTVRDVTHDLIEGGVSATLHRQQEKSAKIETAAEALSELVQSRWAVNDPLLKTEAEEWVTDNHKVTRKDARALIDTGLGHWWTIERKIDVKGKPKILQPYIETFARRKSDPSASADGSGASEAPISAPLLSMGGENTQSLQTAKNKGYSDGLFSPRGNNTTAEIASRKTVLDKGQRDTLISAAEELPQDAPWEEVD